MINLGESRVKGVVVSVEGGVTVTVERCANFLGNRVNRNFFTIKVSISIFEVMHFYSFGS